MINFWHLSGEVIIAQLIDKELITAGYRISGILHKDIVDYHYNENIQISIQ
jgi:hypothetical protein